MWRETQLYFIILCTSFLAAVTEGVVTYKSFEEFSFCQKVHVSKRVHETLGLNEA